MSLERIFKKTFTLASIIFLGSPSWAEPETGHTHLSEVVVTGNRLAPSGIKKDDVNRVEVISRQTIERKQAQTFTQALDRERGVDAQTACAFCGSKRITINGLKGEHTTLLVDGLPLHSTISSFYGVDAIPLGSIDSIEVHRGSGAALTYPESIGGAVNIVTKDILATTGEARVLASDDKQYNVSATGTWKVAPKTGLLLGVQNGDISPVDLDQNRIAEQPAQKNKSVVSKITQKFSKDHQITLRHGYSELENRGGSVDRMRVDKSLGRVATSDDFSGQDVRRKYINDERLITDNIRFKRHEAALSYRGSLGHDDLLKASLGGSWQDFKAVYGHGYDYANTDRLLAGRLEYQQAVSESHLLGVGGDFKSQWMNSESDVLYQTRHFQQDDLRHQTNGYFVQDTWTIDAHNELSSALRVETISTRWFDLNRSIDRTLFAPRFAFKHLHSNVFTSRLSYGVGYRSPLTLFESQHGTSHNGFLVNIQDPEIAHSVGYTLNGQWLDDFVELSVHGTQIENMAYGDNKSGEEAMVFRNSGESYLIMVYDISYGRRILPHWTLEGRYEYFDYPSEYKRKLPVAAIEQRLSFLSEFDWGKWSASQRVTIVGERNLHSYGYSTHYNRAYTDTNIGPTFGDTITGAPKMQRAPLFWTLDATLDYALYPELKIGVSVINALDYTQTNEGDSPTMFLMHGDHYHLDNQHIWGPLRGRQVFASLKGTF